MEIDKKQNEIINDKVVFRVCDECLGVNLNTLIPKLKKKAPNAEFIIGCQSYCGPGRKQTFTLVNSRICIADTEIELMPLVDEKLREQMTEEDEIKYQKRLERRLQRTFYFVIPENITIPVGTEFEINTDGVIAKKAGKSFLDSVNITTNFNKDIIGTYEVIYEIELDGKIHKRVRTIEVINP